MFRKFFRIGPPPIPPNYEWVLVQTKEGEMQYEARMKSNNSIDNDEIERLKDEIERLRDALRINLFFAEQIADAVNIDPDETKLTISVSNGGAELDRRTWRSAMLEARAALKEDK